MANLRITTAQKQFLQSKSRITLYVGGIASGKSWVEAEKAVQGLLQGAYILAMAPTYKTLKIVLMREIEDHLRAHGLQEGTHWSYNRSDMVLEFKLTGGRVYGFSAESIESVRGVTVDWAIMDELALFSSYQYDVVLGRCRRGKVPMQIFGGTTPRGRKSWLYDLSNSPDTLLIRQSTIKNPFLPQEYLDELLKRYEGDFAKQELEGDFIDSDGYAQFISSVLVNSAFQRKAHPEGDKIFGLDVARFGDDSSVLVCRQGNRVLWWKRWKGLTPLDVAEQVAPLVITEGPAAVVVDSVGLGSGAVDPLKRMVGASTQIVEFNGGHRADNALYANARAETWGKARDWLEKGSIDKDDTIERSACSVEYYYNGKNQIALEGKEQLKRRGEDSPDWFDAFSMTFSNQVKGTRKVQHSEVSYSGWM